MKTKIFLKPKDQNLISENHSQNDCNQK